MPGGKIAPDGRPASAPGVGKNARRHDLEQPATPNVGDSDLQYGDRQRLEQAQRIAPKTKQGPAQPRARTGVQRGSDQFSMEVPDPIQFAAQRAKGQPNRPASPGRTLAVDPRPWLPLMRQMASAPNTGGGLTAAMMEQFANMRRHPLTTQANLIDLNEADDVLAGG